VDVESTGNWSRSRTESGISMALAGQTNGANDLSEVSLLGGMSIARAGQIEDKAGSRSASAGAGAGAGASAGRFSALVPQSASDDDGDDAGNSSDDDAGGGEIIGSGSPLLSIDGATGDPDDGHGSRPSRRSKGAGPRAGYGTV